MKPEKLPVVSETLYAGSYWYGDIYRGIRERALANGLEGRVEHSAVKIQVDGALPVPAGFLSAADE